MPIRRVALSARFGRHVGEETEDIRVVFCKGLLFTGIDVALTLGVSVATFLLFHGYMVAPIERGFFCDQMESINKPFYPNTISTTHLLIVTLAGPFVVIFLTEAIFFSQYPNINNRLRKFFATSTVIFLEYLLAFALCTFAMEAGKCGVGRLRPHFLTACKPDWTRIDCTTDPQSFIADAQCTGEQRPVRVARGSFPSGHSAAAVMCFSFLAIYLTNIVKSAGIRTIALLRLMVIPILFVWMMICMVTRVTDNWHHPTDVLGGIVLGLGTVLICFGWKYKAPIESRLNPVAVLIEKAHNS